MSILIFHFELIKGTYDFESNAVVAINNKNRKGFSTKEIQLNDNISSRIRMTV